MLKLAILLLLSFAFIDSTNISQECQSLFEANDPTNCWSALNYWPKASDECKTDCQTGQCCFLECLTRTGYIVEKPEKEKFLEIFEVNNFHEKMPKEKELWMPVICKSYDYCESLSERINGIGSCKIPSYLYPMIDCIKQQNFLNCPKELFKQSERCEAARKFVASQDTCGIKYGDIFLIDKSYFVNGDEKIEICKKLFLENKPSKCARIPSPSITNKTRENCFGKCQEDVDKQCCTYKCENEMFVIGDEIQKEKLVESFRGAAFATWLIVIENAFDVCNPLVSKFKTKSLCSLPDKVEEIVSCMKQEMLLNVPRILTRNDKKCEKIQTFVKTQTTCGKIYGNVFIVDQNYWKNKT